MVSFEPGFNLAIFDGFLSFVARIFEDFVVLPLFNDTVDVGVDFDKPPVEGVFFNVPFATAFVEELKVLLSFGGLIGLDVSTAFIEELDVLLSFEGLIGLDVSTAFIDELDVLLSFGGLIGVDGSVVFAVSPELGLPDFCASISFPIACSSSLVRSGSRPATILEGLTFNLSDEVSSKGFSSCQSKCNI